MNWLWCAALALLQTPPAGGAKAAQAPAPAAKEELAPGVLPKNATAEARATWTALVDALGAKGAARAPITAFELGVTTRIKSVDQDGNPVQQNDVQVRFRYLAVPGKAGYVSRAILDAKGNLETMRGPDGDWLWDADKDDRVQLVGQDYAKDRRELSQTLAIAKNYVALSNPASLRLAALERLAAPPPELPAPVASLPEDSALRRAKQLEWISALSPDFCVVEPVKSAAPPLFRVKLGLDPKSHLPLLAEIVQEADDGTIASETAVLIDFTFETKKTGEGAARKLEEVPRYRLTNDFLVPSYFRVHDPLLPSSPFTFAAEARMSVVVNKGSTLRAQLAPEDFRPPKPK